MASLLATLGELSTAKAHNGSLRRLKAPRSARPIPFQGPLGDGIEPWLIRPQSWGNDGRLQLPVGEQQEEDSRLARVR